MPHSWAWRRMVCSLLLLAVLSATAQDDTLRLPFGRLTLEDGLSQGMINSIAQDHQGFMWFATKDGLNRYDGYQFHVYRHDPADPGSLAENYVNVVRSGPDDRMWLGTGSRGVQVFDPRTEVFTHVPLGPGSEASYVLDIEFDHQGHVWVATSSGLFKVDPDPEGPGAGGPKVERVFAEQCRIAIDTKGHVWGYRKATSAFHISIQKGKTDRIDVLGMTVWSEGLWNSDPQSNVNGMFAVDGTTGRVFGIHPFFIAEYDTVTMKARVVQRMAYPSAIRFEPEDVVIDPKGDMWIGSNQCWRFNTRSGRLTRVLAQ
ncbi:MAG: hypothetical protein KDB95_15675, partial [Flavobacteriales bacterium]|nr:hypothetical protein [Flavobacteriales bacterium]